MAAVSTNLAELEFRDGDVLAAIGFAAEAEMISRASNDTYSAARTQCNTAMYLVSLGRYDEARSVAREALPPLRDAQYNITFLLQHFAAIATLRPNDDPKVRTRPVHVRRV